MSRYDQPTDDSDWLAHTTDPEDFCPQCREHLTHCTCARTYCTYCNHEYEGDRWEPYCSRYCETWAAMEKGDHK